jgi:hypothetical protein
LLRARVKLLFQLGLYSLLPASHARLVNDRHRQHSQTAVAPGTNLTE